MTQWLVPNVQEMAPLKLHSFSIQLNGNLSNKIDNRSDLPLLPLSIRLIHLTLQLTLGEPQVQEELQVCTNLAKLKQPTWVTLIDKLIKKKVGIRSRDQMNDTPVADCQLRPKISLPLLERCTNQVRAN